MNGFGRDQLRRLLDEQIGLLEHDAIRSCANRQGLRERSGSLLEEAFLDLAARLAPTLSVEIGAHEASFSERLKAKLPDLHALAFEANPFVYRRYAGRLGQHPNAIDYRHAAICGEDGTVQLHIPATRNGIPISPDNAISSIFRRTSAGFKYDPVVVPAFALDTVLKSFALGRSVAWIDAEGAQSEILAGGRDYFGRVAAVYIEVERKQAWRDQKLDSEVAENLVGFSLAPIMRDSLAKIQYNEVYIRPDDAIVDAAVPTVLRYVDELRMLIGASAAS